MNNWKRFALLLIDVQEDFWTKEIEQSFPDFSSNVSRLLDVCRSEGIEVVHIRSNFKPDKSDWMIRYKLLDRIPCIDGTPGVDLLSCAHENPGEKVIIKQTFDGFLNPELTEYLDRKQKRFLLVAGLVTSVCVILTSASAAQRGFLVSLVEDCCADKPDVHELWLKNYPFIFERIVVNQIPNQYTDWLADINRLEKS